MRNGSFETLPPFRDPRDELIRYRYRQAGAGLLLALALAAIVVMARLENDPTSALGRILTALAVIGASTGVAILFSALMSHVEGNEKALRDSPRTGALFSGKGSIATDEADAHPRLVALAGDIGDRRRRRLPVRVDLRPGQMVISRAGVGRSDEGAVTATLGSAELVSAEVVPLIHGSGLAVRMRDGTAFAVALPVSGSTLSRKLARWRNTPAPAFSFPGTEHHSGFLQPVTPAITTFEQPGRGTEEIGTRFRPERRVRTLPGRAPSLRSRDRALVASPRIPTHASAPGRRSGAGPRHRKRIFVVLAVAAIVGAVVTPIVARQLGPCARAHHLVDEANLDLSGYFGQIADLRTVFPPRARVPVAVGDEHALDVEQIASARKNPDAWRTALRRSGFTSGWIQIYLSPLGLNEQVFAFRSHEAALGFQAWATDFSCRYTARVFTVPSVPNTIGLQIRYTDLGSSQQVSFVRGARRFLIGIRPMTTSFPTVLISDIEVMTNAAAIYAR